MREKKRNRHNARPQEVLFSELPLPSTFLLLVASPKFPTCLYSPILIYFFLWQWNHYFSSLLTSNITLFLFFPSHSGFFRSHPSLIPSPSSPAFHLAILYNLASVPVIPLNPPLRLERKHQPNGIYLAKFNNYFSVLIFLDHTAAIITLHFFFLQTLCPWHWWTTHCWLCKTFPLYLIIFLGYYSLASSPWPSALFLVLCFFFRIWLTNNLTCSYGLRFLTLILSLGCQHIYLLVCQTVYCL